MFKPITLALTMGLAIAAAGQTSSASMEEVRAVLRSASTLVPWIAQGMLANIEAQSSAATQ